MTLSHVTTNLPAYSIVDEVNQHLIEKHRVVVTAPPGAGKSTLLPLTILQDMERRGQKAKVIVMEPRRIAARHVAMRMAELIGEEVGQTVGYRIRFETRISECTRIEVVTEGVLTRMLIDDATLDGVGVVVFDEFHERSIHSDVALALVREAQQLIRPDLDICVMSATIDARTICSAMDAPLVECSGRMFPVETIRAIEDTNVRDIATAVARCVVEAHRNDTGDILVFLPGQAEIVRCKELLGTSLGDTNVYPLYGNLSMAEQHRAIAPCREGERKVVLATNIAETSLTIEGVRVVIDSGLFRKQVFDERTGLSRLQTVRISQDMADQRRGRAGRVAAGKCYRLWTLATEHRMAECRTPEIVETDMLPVLMDIAAWQGVADVDAVLALPWMTPPQRSKLLTARQQLVSLGAIDSEGRLTPHGQKLSQLPCHPRMAQMMVLAASASEKALAADIAALIEERDPMAGSDDSDICKRIMALRDARQRHSLRQWERIERISSQYRRMVGVKENNAMPDADEVGRLIASAYPERVARNDSLSCYRLANGETAVLADKDELASSEWIAIASMNSGGRVFLASAVNIDSISHLITERDNVSWNSRIGAVVAQRERRIGQLVVDSRSLHDVSRDEVVGIICDAAKKDGLSMFCFDDVVQNLQQRVLTVSEWHPELGFPALDTESVLQNASSWLPLYIGKATTVAELRKINLSEALLTLLTYEQQIALDEIAPTHLTVPTGSKIRVEYRQGAELPVLRVRLQECFGMTDTPRVDNGSRPVLMELLSPGFKPVQLTQDLRSFWQNTYFEVRKELRRRYPKHSWPDDPLNAEPTRKTKVIKN